MPDIHYIYLADDDPDDQLIFSTVIKDNFPHINVDTFFSCHEMMRHLNAKTSLLPDMIFLDVNIPGNQDYQCLRRLKNIPLTKNIPVVIYSTSDHYTSVGKSLEDGAFRYVTKPSSFAELRTILGSIFDEWIISRYKI